MARRTLCSLATFTEASAAHRSLGGCWSERGSRPRRILQDSPQLAAGSFIDDHADDPLPFMRRRQFERADHLSKDTSTLHYKSVPLLIMRPSFGTTNPIRMYFSMGLTRPTIKRPCRARSPTSSKKTGLEGHNSHALRVPLPQKLRLALLLGHPTGQDKQCVAETVQEPHERLIQRLFPPQPHTSTLSPSADRSGLV